MHFAVIGGLLSLLPIWKNVGTGKGENAWQYISSMMSNHRPHITIEEAVENYQRDVMGNFRRDVGR